MCLKRILKAKAPGETQRRKIQGADNISHRKDYKETRNASKAASPINPSFEFFKQWTMKNIILSGGNVFVTFHFLRNQYRVSNDTLKSWSKRKPEAIIRQAPGSAAINYDAIPEPSRLKYGIKSKDEFLLIAETSTEENIQKIVSHLSKALRTKSQSFTSNYRGRFNESHTDKYSKLHCLYTELHTFRESESLKSLHQAVLELSDSPLPLKSYPSFTHKVKEAFAAIEKGLLADFVPSKKHDNSNREKLSTEDEGILNELFKDPRKLSKKECYVRYKHVILNEFGKEPVSYKTVARFLSSNKSKLVCFKSRYGNEQFKAEIGIHTKRTKGKNSFTLCAADGLQLGRSVVFKDKSIGQVTIWIYYDWFSGAILGHAIKRTETFELIRAGFRDVLTKQGGLSPKELVIDTKWANNAEVAKLFNKAGIHIRKKMPYTPEDSIAERNNQELNRIHRQIDEGWASITNRHKDKVHNPDHIRKTRPVDEAEIHKIITQVVEIYNFQSHPETGKSRHDILIENKCDNPIIIEPLDRVKLFGDTRIVTIRNGHFEFKVNTKKYEFEVHNYHEHFDKLDKMKVRVYYDLSDMSDVEAFYIKSETDPEQDTYLGTCKEVTRVNPSKLERTPEDNLNMQHQLKREAQLEKRVRLEEAKHQELVNTFDLLSSLEKSGQDMYKQALECEAAKLYRSIDQSTMEAKELVAINPIEGKEYKQPKRKVKATFKPLPRNKENWEPIEYKKL